MADAIKKDYKNLRCYEAMDEGRRKSFDDLAEFYGRDLNRGPTKKSVIYTLHDFDHHCFNLYRIISNFILKEEGLKLLTQEEIYILNLSVLFHDISMCKGGRELGESGTYRVVPFNRDRHSMQSAEWLRCEFSDQNSLLYKSSDLSLNVLDILCKICQAHSDVKGVDFSRENNGIRSDEVPFSQPGETGDIRTKALAGILRVADELDVTSSRRGNHNEEENLDLEDEGDRISQEHWNRLKLIRALDSGGPSKLCLVVDDNEARKMLTAGDELNLQRMLVSICSKIQREIDDFRNEVLKRHTESSRLTTIETVELLSREEQVQALLSTDLTVIDQPVPTQEKLKRVIPAEDNMLGAKLAPKGFGQKSKVNLVSLETANQIRKYVIEEDLLSVGHYQLNEECCARDWINTRRLVEAKEISELAVQNIGNDILNHYKPANHIIVGVGLTGTILAARVAFYLGIPFTYVIPAHHTLTSDVHEMHIPEIDAEKKVIMIVDCIATGSTVLQAIRENDWGEKLNSVYSVFYRAPRREIFDLLEQVKCSINTLNSDFPIEVSSVEECPYGSNGCRALNKMTDGSIS